MGGRARSPTPRATRSFSGRGRQLGAAHQPVAQRVAGWKDGPTGAAQAPAPALSGPSSTWHQPALHERVAASEVTRLAAGRCAIARLAPLMALCMTGASADAAIGLPWLGYDSDEGPMPKPALLEGTSRLPRPKSVRRLSRNRWYPRAAARPPNLANSGNKPLHLRAPIVQGLVF